MPPANRIAMRKVREILRLTYDGGLPPREVGRHLGVGSTGVHVMLQRFRASKLGWPSPEGLTLADELEQIAAHAGERLQRRCAYGRRLDTDEKPIDVYA